MTNLLSHLPFPVLYGISDFLSLVLRVVGYRSRVIDENLQRCFPEQTESWRKKTRREFYRRMADYFVESLKLGNMSEEQMRKHMVFNNQELFDSLIAEGKSIAIYIGHCFNWEYTSSLPLWTKFRNVPNVEFFEIYRPLSNKYFDRLWIRLRSRFGVVPVPKNNTMRHLLSSHKQGIVSATGFLADQRPSHNDKPYVVDFFGVPTNAIIGTEALARKLDMAHIFWDIRRIKRGYYAVDTRLLEADPGDDSPWPITQAYFHTLENAILRDPPCWLWSHKRWKTLPAK